MNSIMRKIFMAGLLVAVGATVPCYPQSVKESLTKSMRQNSQRQRQEEAEAAHRKKAEQARQQQQQKAAQQRSATPKKSQARSHQESEEARIERARRQALEEQERLLRRQQQEEEARASYEATHGQLSGHEYVDLGLSVKWATANVGADAPGHFGDHYCWGETLVKDDYSMTNSKTNGVQMDDIGGKSTLDVARNKWGASWRMPTTAEWEELKTQCKWKWKTVDGHDGYLVKGPNGNTIFLPAAGVKNETTHYYGDEGGYYWASEPVETNTLRAKSFFFDGVSFDTDWSTRSLGNSVRPVTK